MRCRRGQGQGLDLGWVGDLGWGGVGLGSWGWAFSFLCVGIVECAHGHAYAKQVRIMCVLSVPLLDQVQGGHVLADGRHLRTPFLFVDSLFRYG